VKYAKEIELANLKKDRARYSSEKIEELNKLKGDI